MSDDDHYIWETDLEIFRLEIWGARIVGFIVGMAVMFLLTLIF